VRYTLKDYQVEAVADVLLNLSDARDFYHRRGRESSFALTATTGAGKTVMAATATTRLALSRTRLRSSSGSRTILL